MNDDDFLAEMLGRFTAKEAGLILEAALHYKDGLINVCEFVRKVDLADPERKVVPEPIDDPVF